MPFADRRPCLDRPSTGQLSPTVKQRSAWVWAVVTVVLIVYGSLLPFQLRIDRLISDVQGLWGGLTFSDGGLGDAWTNIALYVPIGLCSLAYRTAPRRPLLWRLPLVFLGAATLSMALEIGQSWTVGRVGSWIDVRSNAIGAILGAVLGLTWSRGYPLWNSLRARFRLSPLSICTAVLLGVLLVYHLLPFDVVRSTADLTSSFHRAQWTIHLPRFDASFQPTLETIGHQAWTASWFILLGYLITAGGRKKQLSHAEIGLRVLAYGVCFIVLLESLQLFSRVHVFDVASMALRILALFFGTWIAWSIPRWPHAAGPRLVALWGLSMAMMLVLGLVMIRISGMPDLRGWFAITIVDWPLESLWRLSTPYAIVEVAEALSIYGPLTIFLYVGLRRAPDFVRGGKIIVEDHRLKTGATDARGFSGGDKIVWLVCLAAGVIEWLRAAGGQHAFDLTEPLLAAGAAWCTNRVVPWLSKVPLLSEPALSDTRVHDRSGGMYFAPR